MSTEKDAPHELVGDGDVCDLCGRWELNGIHDTSDIPRGSDDESMTCPMCGGFISTEGDTSTPEGAHTLCGTCGWECREWDG